MQQNYVKNETLYKEFICIIQDKLNMQHAIFAQIP